MSNQKAILVIGAGDATGGAIARRFAREGCIAPIEGAVFNIGATVRCSITETTARACHKVWEMACFGGFLRGRKASTSPTR